MAGSWKVWGQMQKPRNSRMNPRAKKNFWTFPWRDVDIRWVTPQNGMDNVEYQGCDHVKGIKESFLFFKKWQFHIRISRKVKVCCWKIRGPFWWTTEREQNSSPHVIILHLCQDIRVKRAGWILSWSSSWWNFVKDPMLSYVNAYSWVQKNLGEFRVHWVTLSLHPGHGGDPEYCPSKSKHHVLCHLASKQHLCISHIQAPWHCKHGDLFQSIR